MKWEMYLFEYMIDFVEVLISFYFVTRFYGKKVSEKGRVLLLSSLAGGTCMFLREVGAAVIPDFAVPVGALFLYAWRSCHANVGFAAFLAVLNYFLLGVVNVFIPSLMQIFFGVDNQPGVMEHENRVLILVIVHLAQLLIFELILKLKKHIFGDDSGGRQVNAGGLLVPFFSILVLGFLQRVENHRTLESIYYINLFGSILILIGNFVFFFFQTVLGREREEKAALREYNRLTEMQMRNQRDMGEIYENMCMLRHDISSHLSVVFGYIELEQYEKARDYIEQLRREMDSMESVHTGNVTLDALLGSKGVLARKNGIRVEMEAAVPPDLQIEETHLAAMLGNLYDNALDANLKIEDISKRYIRIEITYREGNLLIHFSNAAKEDAKRIGDTWRTTKAQAANHGFGLKSIDRVVGQYQGFCRRDLKNNVFTCQIRMPDVRIENKAGKGQGGGKEDGGWRG